jgi:hypothetical protein
MGAAVSRSHEACNASRSARQQGPQEGKAGLFSKRGKSKENREKLVNLTRYVSTSGTAGIGCVFINLLSFYTRFVFIFLLDTYGK